MGRLSLLHVSTVSSNKILNIMSQTTTATVELQDMGTYPPVASILQVKKTSDQHLTDHPDSSETQTLGEESSLPPVDRGRDAWLFLAACWVVEAITFGEL